MKAEKLCIVLASAGIVLGAHAAVTWQTVTAGTTLTIPCGTGQNTANLNFGRAEGFNLCCDDGATIAVTDLASGQGAKLFSTIVATNGTAPVVTLDLSGLNGAPFRLQGSLHFKSDATLHIKGTNTLVMGSNEDWPSYYPTFNVPNRVIFDEGVDGKIVFDGQICLYAKPSDLTFEIADDSVVAVHNNILGFGSEITLTNYDLAIFDSTDTTGKPLSTPEMSTITVPTGRILYLFPCQINSSFRWDRKSGIISNNVVLAGGKLGVETTGDARLAGSITGTGDIFCAWTFSAWVAGAWFRVTGPVSFTGNIDLASPYRFGGTAVPQNAKVELGKVDAGLHLGTVKLGNAAANGSSSVRLMPPSSSSAFCTVAVDRVECPQGGGENRILRTDHPVIARIGVAAGIFGVTADGCCIADALAAGAVVSHGGKLQADAYVTLVSNATHYTYGTAPTMLDLANHPLPNSIGQLVPVTGNMTIGSPTSAYQVCVREGAELNLATGLSRMPVKNEGGIVNLSQLGIEPKLWLDASAGASISNVVTHYADSYAGYDKSGTYLSLGQAVCYTNGFPFVNGWYDRRSSQKTVKMWNNRYDNPYEGHHNVMHGVFPFRVTGGLNGMDYISFGSLGVNLTVSYSYVDGTTKDVSFQPLARLYPSDYGATTAGGISTFTARYVFLVFGSQNGGGKALIANHNGKFARGGSTLSAPIFPAGTELEAWIDGVKVDPTANNLLNGGWQVITLDIKNNAVKGLGFESGDGSGNCGGQNYAEVIFIAEELTDAQRQNIEIYLAEKWGLAGQYHYPAGYTPPPRLATVYGTGTVNLDSDATLGGGFAGTVNLNGHALAIDGTALPPTDADISTDGCVGWFDPEQESLCTMQRTGNDNKLPRDRLFWLYDRCGKDDGRYALTAHDITRAPWINASARGFGPLRRWIDFSNENYYNGFYGNNFRFRLMSGGVGTGDVVTNTFRTIVMAQDSVRGGGQPFVDGNSVLPSAAATLYKVRVGKSADSPIYPSGTASLLTGGRTYLDGELVANPSATGFQGRPEILTVIPTTDYGIVCFEHLNNSEKKDKYTNTSAIQGEILMYNRELPDAERQKVEAYLSWKWLGILPTGYSSLTNATLVGAGSVTAANAALLPKFAPDCTADVTLTDGTLAFTLAGDVLNTPYDLGAATLHLPAAATVSVTCAGKPEPGDYPLVAYGALAEGTTFSLNAQGFGGARPILVKASTGLVLHVAPSGMTVIFR